MPLHPILVFVLAIVCTNMGTAVYPITYEGKPAKVYRSYDSCTDLETKKESVWYDWRMEVNGKEAGRGREKLWEEGKLLRISR